MDVKIALIYVDEKYWVDRLISNLRGGQRFSHGAFIIYPDDGPAEWWDVHFRWFTSSLRTLSPEKYAWSYSLWSINNLTQGQAEKIAGWLHEQRRLHVNYDFLQCLGQLLTDKLGLDFSLWDSQSAYQCFELLVRALDQAGIETSIDPGMALGEALANSGLLTLEEERVLPMGTAT